jgi:hypothetical protein
MQYCIFNVTKMIDWLLIVDQFSIASWSFDMLIVVSWSIPIPWSIKLCPLDWFFAVASSSIDLLYSISGYQLIDSFLLAYRLIITHWLPVDRITDFFLNLKDVFSLKYNISLWLLRQSHEKLWG